ncbi:hypothetical protein MTR_5g041445 [Medicago truncatula]|uniref:Uncharacterized protein n=1 Tax=Medicago truncatula TaxID=3880 RepID=A0A072UEI5_MEDTR|nr:hypothetical protein MTR_5g041445 [Medicago truncatula]
MVGLGKCTKSFTKVKGWRLQFLSVCSRASYLFGCRKPKLTIQVIRSLGRSTIVNCQNAHAHQCMIYTISVDLGISIQWLIALADHTVILTCGVLRIQRFPKAMKANVPEGFPVYES